MNERICNVEKCNSQRTALGMCNLHYQRHISGRPLTQEPKPVYETCIVDDCTLKPRSTHATMCPKHYHRVYRYGSINPVHEPKYTDIAGKRYGSIVAVTHIGWGRWICRCDCGRETTSRFANLERGDKVTCGDKSTHYRTANNYPAAHAYVRFDRGPAKNYTCVDCHAPAKHWSYSHTDPDEQRDWSMKGAPYFSTNPDYYEPRCVSCHKHMDLSVAARRQLADR